MNAEFYYTIKQKGEGLFKDKGSKFIGIALPVESEEQIKSEIETIRKNYHDARHHCYAWRLGPDMELFRANDDGEPGNSAGKPILGQIQSRNLTNILVVVVRYFGGTLLGVGGLIQAYRSAASEALDAAGRIKKFVYSIFSVDFEYADMNTVMRILKDLNIEQTEQNFGLNCSLKARVKKGQTENFTKSFEPHTGIGIRYLHDE